MLFNFHLSNPLLLYVRFDMLTFQVCIGFKLEHCDNQVLLDHPLFQDPTFLKEQIVFSYYISNQQLGKKCTKWAKWSNYSNTFNRNSKSFEKNISKDEILVPLRKIVQYLESISPESVCYVHSQVSMEIREIKMLTQ